ncbi:MAG TPA: Mrp/NBP35 family ATP-binding protein [bacterium]|nr:Mrp/NBP35 family ATP-binding protein [bacterium]
MTPTSLEERVQEALRSVRLEAAGKDIVRLRMVRDLRIDGQRASLTLDFPSPLHPRQESLPEEVRRALSAIGDLKEVRIAVTWSVRSAQTRHDPLPGVKNVIAVASGKGGVGKSTIATNLAAGLALAGARSGLLDLDLFGPSTPIAMGSDETPEMDEDGRLVPVVAHGVPFLSMGMLAPGSRPVIWRGPMLHKAVLQLAAADWGELDYLVLDLPPGTGDIQLTVTQSFPVSGAVIVTTPQTIALLDAAKGLAMFRQAHIPILGLVENMSVYICRGCGKPHAIFGEEGGRRLAEKENVPLLARVPLDPALMEASDRGHPAVLEEEGALAMELRHMALRVAAELGTRSLESSPFKVLTN